MIEVRSAIDIAAPAETVWELLVDIRRFHEWNPFIRKAWGSPRVGHRVRVRVRPPLGLPLYFTATILARDAHHELRWRGHLVAPWLARGEHAFTLEPSGKGHVRFVQREVFGGLLPLLARRLLAHETRRGFEAMNRALKKRAEDARSAQLRASRAAPADRGAS